MTRLLLPALLLLFAAGRSAADDIESEVAKLKYGDTVGFFGRGRANRHYEYMCSRCGGKGYYIPTGSHSEAASWVRLHCRQAHGMAGGGTSSGTSRLNDLAAEAMARGLVERDGEMFAMGASAALLGGLMEGLFSASGPSAAEVARARALREEEERRRLEEIARLEELARRERIVRAAGLREEWDRRDAEMGRRLEGVFDLVRPRGEHPFFEDAPEFPPESPPEAEPVSPAAAVGGPAPRVGGAPMPVGLPDPVIDLGFLLAAARRAEETDRFARGLSRWEPVEDPRERAFFALPEGLKKKLSPLVEDVKDEIKGRALERIGIRNLDLIEAYRGAAVSLKEDVFTRLAAMDLRDPDEWRKWADTSERLGRDFARDVWSDPSRRQERYLEAWR